MLCHSDIDFSCLKIKIKNLNCSRNKNGNTANQEQPHINLIIFNKSVDRQGLSKSYEPIGHRTCKQTQIYDGLVFDCCQAIKTRQEDTIMVVRVHWCSCRWYLSNLSWREVWTVQRLTVVFFANEFVEIKLVVKVKQQEKVLRNQYVWDLPQSPSILCLQIDCKTSRAKNLRTCELKKNIVFDKIIYTQVRFLVQRFFWSHISWKV